MSEITHMRKAAARVFPSFDANAPKKPTNLSVNADLLSLAKELGINLSQTLERRLIEVVREESRRRWLAENAEAVDNYNTRVDRAGVFSDGLRRF
jgi:antitoxin CcdA